MSLIGLGLVLAVAGALVCGPVLRSLPEPPEAEAAGKIPYRRLAGPPFALAVWGLSSAAGVVVGVRVGAPAAALWLVLSSVGVILVAVDAVTTWLPLPLTQALWAATAGAYLLSMPWLGVAGSIRCAAGAVLTGVFYWLVWRLTGGAIGFGDVRLAPVLGAVAAAQSWTILAWALLLGSLAGAAYGLCRLALGRRGPFAYGPALLLGPYLALALPP